MRVPSATFIALVLCAACGGGTMSGPDAAGEDARGETHDLPDEQGGDTLEVEAPSDRLPGDLALDEGTADAADAAEPEAAPPAVYPGATWGSAAPAEKGMSAPGLEAFEAAVGGRGCVVRSGVMVHTWGDQARRADIASACKPFYAHFLFLAIEDGKIASDRSKVVDFEPRLADLNAALGHKDREIEWRHLAGQVSCYGVRERPGAAFDYSDYNMALFFDTLFLKAWRSSYDRIDGELLHPLLADLIECQDDPTFMAFGSGDRPGRTAISVRDFARFGLLYLRGGRWKEAQLVDAAHVALVTATPHAGSLPRTAGQEAEMIDGQRSIGGGNNQTDHFGSYSYAWWTNGLDRDGDRHWPDVPVDAYGAFGHGGKRACVVIPSLDLVASWNDSGIDAPEKENAALGLLVGSVTD